jgi:hypothetical protein
MEMGYWLNRVLFVDAALHSLKTFPASRRSLTILAFQSHRLRRPHDALASWSRSPSPHGGHLVRCDASACGFL